MSATAWTDNSPAPLSNWPIRSWAGSPDPQALAVVGYRLSQLTERCPAWVERHKATLFDLRQPHSPARTWLTYGQPGGAFALVDRAELAELLVAPPTVDTPAAGTGDERSRDRDALAAVRRAQQRVDATLDRVAWALLDAGAPLGPVRDFFRQVAGRPRGAEAVSQLLSCVAWRTAKGPSDASERAVAVWEAALDAGLPSAALAGAGEFAYSTGLDDETWLTLTRRTAEQELGLNPAHAVAQRAAGHPDSPDALIIAARLLGAPLEPFHKMEVRRQADALLRAAKDSPQWRALQSALVDAGEVQAAFVQPANT
ncbi:hypothetical protein [Streptacidiphilus sp. MAP5-3]|uniref:hypothetical protein n=1 Tax=unclassified Streptacidiphilus TaxID=2643834 RepID=UPI003513F60B